MTTSPGTRKRARKTGTAARSKATRKRAATRKAPGKRRGGDALLAPLEGAERRDVGRVRLEVVRAGSARVKRMIYPAGFKWSVDMKGVTGTELCMHAHVGFLARGRIHIEYADGCREEYRAPQVIAIEPGHDGWVVGSEPVVLIEFDFERDTISRLGMPATHRHD
jgi:hypothetical protein